MIGVDQGVDGREVDGPGGLLQIVNLIKSAISII